MGLEKTLALTPALSPRRGRPELLSRLAPPNPPASGARDVPARSGSECHRRLGEGSGTSRLSEPLRPGTGRAPKEGPWAARILRWLSSPPGAVSGRMNLPRLCLARKLTGEYSPRVVQGKLQKPKGISMKNTLFIGATVLLAGALLAAESSPKDDVIAATKKLGDQANYSWKTTVVVPESAQFKPGPSEGQTEKDGFTHLTLNFGDNTTQVFMKGDKTVVSDPDGGWQALADLDSAEGARRV